jgi:hypothetical protein
MAPPDARQPKKASKTTHTHKRHATPAPAYTTPAHPDLLRTACAPTSTQSNGFCVIWVCISSSSGSMWASINPGAVGKIFSRWGSRTAQTHMHTGALCLSVCALSSCNQPSRNLIDRQAGLPAPALVLIFVCLSPPLSLFYSSTFFCFYLFLASHTPTTGLTRLYAGTSYRRVDMPGGFHTAWAAAHHDWRHTAAQKRNRGGCCGLESGPLPREPAPPPKSKRSTALMSIFFGLEVGQCNYPALCT